MNVNTTKTVFAAVSIFLFLLTCSKQNTLYDPSGSEPARCFAMLSDTLIENPTLADTVHLVTSDTIHTGDSISFVGIITPANADLKSVKWDFGDGIDSSVAISIHRYAKGGKYTGVFTIEDKVGLTFSDTVTVHVNTPPDSVKLLAPIKGQTGIDPNSDSRILKWSCSDPDSEALTYYVFFNSSKGLVSPVMTSKDTSVNIVDKITLVKLTTYYWMVKAVDKYGDSAVSDTFSFKTKDPDVQSGSVEGYARFQGWQNHKNISISIIDPTGLVNPQDTITNDSGYFFKDGLPPKTYTVLARDNLKKEFISDSCTAIVQIGMTTVTDPLVLKDPYKPVISKNLPTATQSTRMPVISANFSDRGSGILVSSARILFNDSNITPTVIVSDSGWRWTPPARLPDGIYKVDVCVKDSAGNKDSLGWSFMVYAMKLIPKNDTTVSINDTVWFPCSVYDAYSAVKQYKWDFGGNGVWDDSVADVNILVKKAFKYTHVGTFNAVLYAQDEAGKIALDTIKVTVLLDPPVVTAGNDTTVFVGDTLKFVVHACDGYGRVEKYYWSFDGVNFIDSTNDSILFIVKAIPDSDSIFIKVRDDDGIFSSVSRAEIQYVFFKKKWVFETGGPLYASPAVGGDGTVYISSDSHKLYAIDPDGTKKWDFVINGSTGCWSSPAVGSDGTVYVGSLDQKLYAVNPDGSKKWDFATGGIIRSSPAIGADGTIYVGSNDNKLYAVGPSGIKKWEFETGSWIVSSPAIGADGTIYVGNDDGKFYAVNPDGIKKWEIAMGGKGSTSPAIGADGTIFVGCGDRLYAVNSDGTNNWQSASGAKVESSPAIGVDNTVYVGNGIMLTGMNPDGTKKWDFANEMLRTGPAIGADGTVFAGSHDYKLYAVNPDGTKKWEFEPGAPVWSSPAIAPDGTIYFGSNDGKLFALATRCKGLAPSPWPMVNRDPQHTGRAR